MLRHIVLLVLLGFLPVLHLNAQNGGNTPPGNTPPTQTGCALLAPTGLHVTSVTTTTLGITWDYMPGAYSYKVEAKNAITNQVYYAGFTVTNEQLFTGLPSATPIFYSVQSVCFNGAVSPNMSSGIENTNIVVELVMNGYQSCPVPNWNEPTGSNVSFNFVVDEEIELWVLNGSNATHKTNIQVSLVDEEYVSSIKTNANKNMDYILPDFYGARFLENNLGVGNIKFNFVGTSGQDIVAKVVLDSGLTLKWKSCSGGNNNKYNDKVIRDTDAGNIETTDRTDLENGQSATQTKNILSISPNPFTDFINFTVSSEEASVIDLLNTNGAILKTVTLEAGESNWGQLSTEDLPSGTYILRSRSATTVESHLVIKTK